MCNKMLKISIIFALLAINGCYAVLPTDAETLVLLDSLAIRETHSMFFRSLTDRGFKLTYKLADDSGLILSRFGEYLYKNLIIFAPSVEEFGGEINVDILTQFIDDGGNILVTGSENSGDALREFASECGFEMDEEGASVIDHVHHDTNADVNGEHTTILTSTQNLIDASIIVGDTRKQTSELIYRGAGLIADKENPLVLRILNAEYTAFSYIPNQLIKDYPNAIGRNTLLIVGLQARNNARVIFSGSLYFFSDEAFIAEVANSNDNNDIQKTTKPKISSNHEVSIALSKWVFGESGRLRVSNVNHHKKGETKPPIEAYTITETVVYTIKIEELKQDKWQPFRHTDVQLEFVRIDPFVRTQLKPLNDHFVAEFKIPDVYGVYQFKVDYDRTGYSHVYNTTQLSVRPLEHTQYERFISSAYPYYMSAFSMMIGVFLFSFVYLHFKEETNTNTKGGTKPGEKKTQ